VPVGYSGHEIGHLPTLAAVARGASLVERHVTTDRTLAGFDHKLSLEPDELRQMIGDIRVVEQTLGTGDKAVSETEMTTRRKYHVSLVAVGDIPAGSIITRAMLTLKNPGTGLPHRRLADVVGRRAKRLIPGDTLLELGMVEPVE
jgi:sialic acid synthase SpsE